MTCRTPESKLPKASDLVKAQEKICMDKVIAIDNRLGSIRNHASESISLSETIKQYVAELKKIDFQNCPKDFTAAFEKHQKAWMGMIEVTDKHTDLRGELHALFDKIEASEDKENFKTLLKVIWDTWAEIEEAMKN